MELKVGDYVTRNSYHNDLVFKIIKIESDVCYLKGVNIRLYADSSEDDLSIYNIIGKLLSNYISQISIFHI